MSTRHGGGAKKIREADAREQRRLIEVERRLAAQKRREQPKEKR